MPSVGLTLFLICGNAEGCHNKKNFNIQNLGAVRITVCLYNESSLQAGN